LPHDERIVFRSKDRTVVKTADGDVITDPVVLESLIWKKDILSYEEYRALKDAIADSKAQIEELRNYQFNVLGEAQERLADEGNPMKAEEIRDMQNYIMDQAPVMLKNKMLPQTAPQINDADNKSSLVVVEPIL